jgi:AAA15 family ATPase/GTPase
MLPSLEIKNFRNLKDLKIKSLGRINLITGKNNTGKSSLLEAVSLYATRCDLSWIKSLLEERGEYNVPPQNSLNSVDATTKTFSSLFSDRNIGYSTQNAISIGVIEDKLPDEQSASLNAITIRFVKYVYEVANGAIYQRKKIIIKEEDFVDNVQDSNVGLEMRYGDISYVLALDDSVRSVAAGITPRDNSQFIRVRNIDREINRQLWNTIALTEKENYVIGALQIIEPDIERLTFIEDEGRERKAVVKLKGDNIQPIRSMGDGINRVLTIILALVNSDNGYLLIDEFENGLHHSVQEKLWEIIFKLSGDLNVQVFATTHSEDCIRGFESILNSNQNYGEGKLIRLDNFKGKIRQTEYTPGELKVAAENYIETR